MEPILVLNSGSSSIRAASFDLRSGGAPHCVASLRVTGISRSQGHLERTVGGGPSVRSSIEVSDHREAFSAIFGALAEERLPDPVVVGHRIVRGPRGVTKPTFLGGGLWEALERLQASAPLHLPAELTGVRSAREHFPAARQAACFDCSFFASLPTVARRLPIPRKLASAGVERIGYHGLSYEFVVSALDLPDRTVVAHLGSGASMTALQGSRPVDTTMGFTPAGGLMMGTRSGDLDPGVLVAAMRREHLDAAGMDRLVNLRSGLTGVSGGESDMRSLLESSKDDALAREAVESFCWVARKHLGSMMAVLGGIDLLVFTGGIGEHAPEVRAEILRDLEGMGFRLDGDANRKSASTISAPGSSVTIRIVHTDEELVIARHVAGLMGIRADGGPG